MMLFLVIVFTVLGPGILGTRNGWPPFNRWSFLMYVGIAFFVALEFFAAYSQASLSESNYAAGVAVNVAIAQRNEQLAHQSVIFSLVAAFPVFFSVMIYRLKIRRTAA
jgi:hypothetical protein